VATNKVFESGKILEVAVASTVKSGDMVVINDLVGVALTDYDASSGKATIDFAGVYLFSVKGVNGAGNVAVAAGDALYYVSGDNPPISKKTSGIPVGHALATVGSGSTASIAVRSNYGSARSPSTGMFVSPEQTGSGSQQTIAHGLGAAPSVVIIALTEFASNLNVDVAEGTHTSTNVLVTVTNGAKYKVLAIR